MLVFAVPAERAYIFKFVTIAKQIAARAWFSRFLKAFTCQVHFHVEFPCVIIFSSQFLYFKS